MERNGLSGERWNKRYDFLILYIIFLCFSCLVMIICNFNDPPSTIPHAGYCLRVDTVDGLIIRYPRINFCQPLINGPTQ